MSDVMQEPVTVSSVHQLIASLREIHNQTTDSSRRKTLEDAIGVLEYYLCTTQTFEAVLRAEEGIQFEDGYQVNVAALLDGLFQIRSSKLDTPEAKRLIGIADAALKLSGGDYGYTEEEKFFFQYTAETCPGRPCSSGCDHRGVAPRG
jgi:hypothetical protein